MRIIVKRANLFGCILCAFIASHLTVLHYFTATSTRRPPAALVIISTPAAPSNESETTTTTPIMTTPAAAAAAAAELVICMIMAKRPNGLEYPQAVLQSLLPQLNDNNNNDNSISLTIVHVDHAADAPHHNMTTGGRAREIELGDRRTELHCPEPTVDTPDNTPPCKVQQQGLDFAAALQVCAAHALDWVLMLEDDMLACPTAIPLLLIALSSLDPRQLLLARFAQEPGVAALPVHRIPSLARQIQLEIRARPVDHVLYQSDAWDTLPVRGLAQYTHPTALFRHIGHVSTFGYRNSEQYHQLYDGERMSSRCFQPIG